jgi:hypothetical protein
MNRTAPKLRLGRALLGVALALCLLSGNASAAPTAQDKERAHALMDAGDARFEAKQYAAALEQYKAADDIMGVPTTGIEVGRTLERLGKLLEAREVLRRVSEFPQRSDEPRPFSSARSRADRLLGDIAPRIPRVTLEFAGLPEGVAPEITWDGQHIDPARIGGYIEANPGIHHAVGVAAGYPDAKRDVKLAEGQALQVTLSFAPAGSPASPGAASQPPGTPTLDSDRNAPPTPANAKAKKPVLLWVSVGVAAAGVAAGTATGLQSLALTKSAKHHCTGNDCTSEAQSDIDHAKTFANVANVAFGVGVAALGVATWQFFSYRAASKRENAPVEPHVTASVGLGNVSLEGSF